MKKMVTLIAVTVIILSVCFALTDEAYKGITEIRKITRTSENPLCSDICMDNNSVYILNTANGYEVSILELNGSEKTLTLENDTHSYGKESMISVSGETIYILDNSQNAIYSYTLSGEMAGKHPLPEGTVTSFDTCADKAYMQFDKGITLASYDFTRNSLVRSYRFDDGFGGNHKPSCVNVNRFDGTLRLSRLSDAFLIEDYDTFLNPRGTKKTALPYDAVSYETAPVKGDLVSNGICLTEKYDYAPITTGRFNGISLYPVEVYRFKSGKKYPDMIYKVKGMNRFKGYLKLLGVNDDSIVLYIHDENGSATRSMSKEAQNGDYIIKVEI